MKIIASDDHQHHNPLELSRGKLELSTESPKRAAIIDSALRTAGHVIEPPDPLDFKLLGRIHTQEYIDFLATAWERWVKRYGSDAAAIAFTWPGRGATPVRPDDLVGQLGYHSFSADSSIVEGTWQAVTTAAACAQTAADRVSQGANAYALCRPPGHHATKDQFGGYCFLNNAAVAAQRLRDNGNARVAVLDIDYHHGNGTQDIFYARSDVLTLSIHADPVEEFPWFAGHANETGAGTGIHFNVNLPLARGATLDLWKRTLDKALERITDFNATALVVALGVDTYINDPLGTFALTTRDYIDIATQIRTLKLPTVITQEGGYAVDAIGDNVVAFLKPFTEA